LPVGGVVAELEIQLGAGVDQGGADAAAAGRFRAGGSRRPLGSRISRRRVSRGRRGQVAIKRLSVHAGGSVSSSAVSSSVTAVRTSLASAPRLSRSTACGQG